MRNSSYGTTHFCMFSRQVQQEARIRSGSPNMALTNNDEFAPKRLIFVAAGRRSTDQRAHFLAQDRAAEIVRLEEVENDDGHLVVHA